MAVVTGKLGITRLTGDDLTALRSSCFERDSWQVPRMWPPRQSTLLQNGPTTAHTCRMSKAGEEVVPTCYLT